MIAKAKFKFARVSPKKVKNVIDLVRGKKVEEALDILSNLNKAASSIILKVLNSAVSNAGEDASDSSSLYISKIIVNQGPFLKRYKAAAFGRATTIRRRTSHIEIEIDAAMPRDITLSARGRRHSKALAAESEATTDGKASVKKTKEVKSKIKRTVATEKKGKNTRTKNRKVK